MSAETSDPREVGRLIALRQLETRPRTERELHETLCGRGIPAEVATELIARFVEVGLLDDRAYARLWVESRIRSRGLGVASLRSELRSRKVPDPIIDEVLAQIDMSIRFWTGELSRIERNANEAGVPYGIR